MADADKVRQILVNLLSNAIKFTPANGSVSIECSAEEGIVQIRVQDTGTGIPPEKLQAIFEPFVQLDRSLTNVREGSGLGLAISRDLARGMGGDLCIASTVGQGSTFTLTLPRAN
jgi:signal transduction histidine kinase